jgi:hypothetical protein
MMSEQHFQESIDTFKVKFEGGNSIDAELFTRTINNTIELVKASSQAVNPNAFLRLEIKATKEGSFETIIDAVVKYSEDFFTKDNIRLATEIVTGYLAFLQIKSHLKGRKPKSIERHVENTTVENQEGELLTTTTNIVNCYFNDSKIDNSIVQIFTDLKTSGREGIIVEHNNYKQSFIKADYDNMSTLIVEKNKSILSKEHTEIIKECELTIKKPDLIGNSKWEIIFAGRSIAVKIDDKIFISQIKEGKIKISGGYRLITDLNICTETDNEYNIINVDYTVIKVCGIKDREEQLTLFDDNK